MPDPVALTPGPGVLVVDDDRVIRLMVQLGLERDGFAVWLAAGGREALAVYREHAAEIAVVLLDVRMPGMDGPETLAALREEHADVPVCFMSGDMGGYAEDELLRLGAGHVIPKPFRLNELCRALRLMAAHAPAGLLPACGV